MRKTMRAVAVLSPGVVRVVDDVPVPTPGDYDALCRVHACGFCSGTDFQILNGHAGPSQAFLGFPTILGHEGAGEVVAVGPKVRHIAVGDRFIHPNLRPEVGNDYTKTYGGMAEFGLVSDHQAMLEDGFSEAELPFYKKFGAFPKSLDFTDAGMLLSISECYSAARNFGVTPGSRVLIYGAGPMGACLARCMKLRGASHITMIDGIPERLENARHGARVDRTINFTAEDPAALLHGERFDFAADAVGQSAILAEASDYLRPGGKVCALGVLKGQDRIFDLGRLQSNTCLHMLNFPSGEYDLLPEVIALIEHGELNPRDFYSHVIPFTEIDRALELVRSKQAFKVILTFDT